MTAGSGRAADPMHDVVIVGGGHNGLVCAAYLARAGLRVLVLERRATAGGAADTVTLMPGVRAPGLVHSIGRLQPRVARELDLAKHGLYLLQPDALLTALDPAGAPLSLWAAAGRTAAELEARSPGGAARWAAFDSETRAFAALLARINGLPPPDVEGLRRSDVLSSVRLWFGYRGLGGRRAREFLRVLPMSIADYLEDSLDDPLLRAALAWRGVRLSALAPSDAGSAQVFLSEMAGAEAGAAGEHVVARGGPAALTEALLRAAQARGAELRTSAEVVVISADGGRANGVVLAGGEQVRARVVVSGADPKRTLLGLVDPELLGPTMGWEADNLRLGGAVSIVQLALSRLPDFAGVDDAGQRLSGRILVAPSLRALDRAADAVKARRVAETLVLEATIPTLLDPGLVDAGAGAAHVMSVLVQGTPYHRREGDWDDERDDLGDRVLTQLEAVAPGIGGLVVGRRVLTPLDLERDYGLTEGHPLHGEPSLDQWFAWRPLFGYARYRMPVRGLYLCGAGAHPGGGITGGPGRLAAQEVIADLRRRR
jgi:phytoene dehydrogenase-like protein